MIKIKSLISLLLETFSFWCNGDQNAVLCIHMSIILAIIHPLLKKRAWQLQAWQTQAKQESR